METHKKLEEWIKKMGYDGEIPSSLKQLCIPSTNFIWQQIIEKVKPKQEIEFIRRNIIINRLREQDDSLLGPLDQSFVRLPIEEIEVWKKKKEIRRKLEEAEKCLEAAESKVNETARQNKMKYITLENIRKKNEEIEEKTFLYKEKSKQLQNDISKAEEMLSLIKNLTPVESTDTTNKEKVLETLQECANRLKEYIEKHVDSKSSQSSAISVTASQSSLSNQYHVYATPGNRKASSSQMSIYAPSFFTTVKQNQYLDSLDLNNCYDTSVKQQIVEKFYSNAIEPPKDEKLDGNIEQLLTNNNRFIVFNALREVDRRYQKELADLISESNKLSRDVILHNKKEFQLTKLQAKYVEYELKVIKSNLMCAKLRKEIKKLQTQHIKSLESHFNLPNLISRLQETLKLQQKEAGLDAAFIFAEKVFKQLEQPGETTDLALLQQKLHNTEKAINDATNTLKNMVSLFNANSVQICKTHKETCTLAKQQQLQFTGDLSWTAPLTYRLISNEIDVFNGFPLEYNRSVTVSGSKVPLRDISLSLPFEKNLNANMLSILATIVNCPYSPPETYLVNLARDKLRMEAFKKLQVEPKSTDITTYKLSKFENTEEEYVTEALKKCSAIVCCESTKKTLNFPEHLEETMKLWIEMPLGKYISPKRLYEGHPYEYYDRQFNDLYQRL